MSDQPAPTPPCDPKEVLHDGHLAITAAQPCARKGYLLLGWRCVNCGKESQTWTMVRR
jgi:hypothetical protein